MAQKVAKMTYILCIQAIRINIDYLLNNQSIYCYVKLIILLNEIN